MKFKAVRTRPTPGTMNKTERAFSDHLAVLRSAGEIDWYDFESIRLVIGDRCSYTPDFVVMAGGALTFYEVKGFWRDDARVKIKVAARKFFMFDFVAVQKLPKKDGGGWAREAIYP